MSSPAPVMDWAAVGFTPAALFAQVTANATPLALILVPLAGLALALRYGSRIKRTIARG